MVFSASAGSEEICPVCYWQDDLFGMLEPYSALGPNKVSLVQAQKHYSAYGIADPRYTHVKGRLKSASLFAADSKWRAVSATDKFAPGRYDPDKGGPYYWRDDYWLAA